MKKYLPFLLAAVCIAAIVLQRSFARPTQLPRESKYIHRTTFKVANVTPATDTLETTDYRDLLTENYVKDPMDAAFNQHLNETGDTNFKPPARHLECCSRDRRPLVRSYNNGFYDAVYHAYAEHRRLVLSPDMVWLAVMQGFSNHVNQNSEALRKHFVQHEGKKVIEVKMDGHVQLGRDDSDWEWVFAQFQQQIGEKTSPELAQLAAGRYSATNTDAAVAFDITLMAATQKYFDFWGSVMCGIPEITLEGTADDWAQIEHRAAQLSKYDLDWWLKDLLPVLAQFTRAARGEVDHAFWSGMVKIYEEDLICASEDHPTGWILTFFPYIKGAENGLVRNPVLGLPEEKLFAFLPEKTENDGYRGDYFCDNGVRRRVKPLLPLFHTSSVPSGVAECILNVDNNGDMIKMELKAGFFGMRQDLQTGALRPEIGWAIIGTGEKPDGETIDGYEKHKGETRGD